MRYAFISDVHGNLEALQGVFRRLGELNVDRTIFLGDAVGYGPNPNEVCDLIRSRAAVSILGNHDAAVAGRMDYSAYYDAARRALDYCVGCLSPDNMAWLRAMPYKVREGDLEFCHGAPVDPEGFHYLFAPEQVVEMGHYESLARTTFIGHSHLALAFVLHAEGDEDALQVQTEHGPTVQPPPTDKAIITVGSVGQPRDRNPHACCGVFDSTAGVFEYHRVAYDSQTTRDKIVQAGLPTVFGDRLLFGV